MTPQRARTPLDVITLAIIALGLAMDAFAVSIAASVMLGKVTPRQVFRLSFHFGLFQGLMPIVGWLAGMTVQQSIKAWDHWVAFGLLVFIGGRAILSAWRGEDERKQRLDPTRGLILVALSIATSIDALAVGLSFSALQIKILTPVLVIAATAAGMTILGMVIGRRLGQRFGRQMEFAGGLVLIAIGVKILVEHLMM